MSLSIVLQFVVVLAAIWMGARYSGVGLGLWGAVGLLVLTAVFGVNPTSPPVDVMLIILAVIMAASVMDAAGGIDFLVRIAERDHPRQSEVRDHRRAAHHLELHLRRRHRAHRLSAAAGDLRDRAPERRAARAADGGGDHRFAAGDHRQPGRRGDRRDDRSVRREGAWRDWGLPEILMICVPATLTGVVAAAHRLDVHRQGPEGRPGVPGAARGRRRFPRRKPAAERPPLTPAAKRRALIFLVGVALVVLFGFFPALRTLPGAKSPLGDARRHRDRDAVGRCDHAAGDQDQRRRRCPKTATLRAGVVAVIGIFGLAWLGDSFIAAHKDVIVPAIGKWAEAAPWTFAFGLFFASVLLYSQAATTRALMPLGMALGIPPQFLIAMFPSVNGYFFIPTYGSLIAAINFDLSGTTKIGKYVLNHSFMIPGLVATSVTVVTGLALARVMF